MRSATLAAALLGLCLHPLVQAQQGANTAVLPPRAAEATTLPHLKTDLLLQRQVEPDIAVSTRNPQTLLAFFNDYRAVDIPDDPGLGESGNAAGGVLARLRPVGRLLARALRKPSAARRQVPTAAAEAWVGMSRSYDGGLTWTGGFLPGAPFDPSPASAASPVSGLQAATDPVVKAAPCGRFYVVFLAFTRGGASRMAVARYVDLNNREGGDPIEYLGTTIIESANNATNGYFIDKPFLEVDPVRTSSADACAHNVYVSYTTFNGLDKAGKFQSKVTLARSGDGGATFRTLKLNMPFNQNQGTAIAVDPRPGTPATTGGGSVYLIWRHFFAPDTMVLAKSTDFGATFGKPASITASAATPTLQTFDQRSQSTLTHAPGDLAFRSNAFPTIAVTGSGTIVAAWQERVNVTGPAGLGLPAAQGSPRIVVTRSSDGGRRWTDVTGAPGERRAIDFADRDGEPGTPGAGLLPQPRASGPQVMPKLVFGGGRLMLLYYESRGILERSPLERIVPADLTNDAISGIDRVIDVRAARLHPGTGALIGTVQVSRYPIRADADLSDGETVDDVAPVNAPCFPDASAAPGAPPLPACVRRVNRANVPQSASGTTPFLGDYIEMAAAVQFVPGADGSAWRWALTEADVPHAGFHAIFADNRNQAPPTAPADRVEAERYKFYAPPGLGFTNCVNPGSRNTDVFTARVNGELVVTAPTSFKQLGTIQRAFPLTVANGTGITRHYRLRITQGAALASFAQTVAGVDEGELEIFGYSSSTKVVYLDPSGSGTVTITVQEITGFGGPVDPARPSGTATLNLDGSNPPVLNVSVDSDTETHTPFVQNPFVQNPFVQNGSPSNPFVQNPFVQNPFVQNATVYDTTDVTWTVQNLGNTTSSYLAVVNVDNPLAFTGGTNPNYAFQLIVSKPSASGRALGCDTVNELQDQILASVAQNPFVQNPFVQNPFVQNPFVQNPFVQNPFVQNATFAVAPADGAGQSIGSHDGTTHARREADFVHVTLRVYRLAENPALVFDPVLSPPSLAVVAQSRNIVDGILEPEVTIGHQSPDLVPAGALAPLAAPVPAGQPLAFPAGGFTVLNTGNAAGTAVDGQFRHGVYLSTDAAIDAGDTLLGFVTTTAHGAGVPQVFGPITAVIPPATPSGSYFIGLLVDLESEVSELDETNNSASVPVTVVAANTAPVAGAQTVTTLEDTPVALTLTALDADGDSLAFTVLSAPALGTLSGTAPALIYTPAADVSGTDTFTFKASDGALDSAPATVTIVVGAVNDPPVAAPDTATAQKNGPAVIVPVLANDTDIDGGALQVVAVTQPAHGTAAFTPVAVAYTPALNFVGIDTFAYTVSDGQATATAIVTVTTQGAPSYGFIGLLSPWTANPVAVAKIGSSFPLGWRYTNAAGAVIASASAAPQVRIRGPFVCGGTETAGTLSFVADPGSSGFQYFASSSTWQFNWQTKGLKPGCYNVRIFSMETAQLDGPFLIRLQR
jgi:hypothetical protein